MDIHVGQVMLWTRYSEWMVKRETKKKKTGMLARLETNELGVETNGDNALERQR